VKYVYIRFVNEIFKLIWNSLRSHLPQYSDICNSLGISTCLTSQQHVDSLYPADLLQLVKRCQLITHAYADDTQIYRFYWHADSAQLCEKVSVYVDEVSAWMASNQLQLNQAKTELLWCSSSCRLSTTSDPVWSGPYWQHLYAASFFYLWPRDLHRCWHDHEDPCHSRCQSTLCGSTSDPEHVVISVTSCLADLGSCTDCQQSGLLQLDYCRYL